MTRDAAVTRSLLAALLALVPGMATAADPPRPAAHRASQPATISISRDGRNSPVALINGSPAASRLPRISGRSGRL
jgi:hypothetical protein